MAYVSRIKDSNNSTYNIRAYKAAAIPTGTVDSTSTSTVFTATIDGIDSLYDGVCVYLTNDVVASASGATLNINSLGAKPIYLSNKVSTGITIEFSENVTGLFVYNSSRVSGGCWDFIATSSDQSDWEESDTTDSAYIQNKPSIRAGEGTNSIVEGNAAPSKEFTIYITGEAQATTFTYTTEDNITPTEEKLKYEYICICEDGSGNLRKYQRINSINKTTQTISFAHYLSSSALSNSKVLIYAGESVARATGSHAEGYGTFASSPSDHTEGKYTFANGNVFGAAHAEGYDTTAINAGAHSEGSHTITIGEGSHVEGYYTEAHGIGQHVQGKYNIVDTNNTYADIVGNGSSSARSNAHTLDWSGNGWYAGKLTVGAAPTNNMDVATKQYVDESKDVFTITFSAEYDENEQVYVNTYTKDKTDAEIIAAYNSGALMRARIFNLDREEYAEGYVDHIYINNNTLYELLCLSFDNRVAMEILNSSGTVSLTYIPTVFYLYGWENTAEDSRHTWFDLLKAFNDAHRVYINRGDDYPLLQAYAHVYDDFDGGIYASISFINAEGYLHLLNGNAPRGHEDETIEMQNYVVFLGNQWVFHVEFIDGETAGTYTASESFNDIYGAYTEGGLVVGHYGGDVLIIANYSFHVDSQDILHEYMTFQHIPALENGSVQSYSFTIESDGTDDTITKTTSTVTVPSVTLNGSTTTTPSFYAPTNAGTSGYVLKSNGSGAPTWAAETDNNTTYSISMSSNIITLTGSDGNASTIALPIYNGNYSTVGGGA